jgi:hypothetical protein
MSCAAWSVGSNNNGIYGLVLNSGGGFQSMTCQTARAVACCKPQPVPAPTSSLMRPIGASGLAALSLMKSKANPPDARQLGIGAPLNRFKWSDSRCTRLRASDSESLYSRLL